MTVQSGRVWFWLVALAVVLVLLYLLRGILLPFVAGMAVAYFLDPIAVRLERAGLSRGHATIALTLSFFLAAVLVVSLLAPLISDQVVDFVQRLPDLAQQLIHRGRPLWRTAKSYLSPQDLERLREAAGAYAGTVVVWVGTFFSGLVTRSLAILNILSLVFITPVVTFYLLRDWRGFTRNIDHWLPRAHAQTIREQLVAIDHILACFVRGQALVCLSLGAVYGIGLSVIGLQLGLIVGAIAGMLSFVPYMGTLTGLVVATGLALAQTQDWVLPVEVAGVFAVGNILEGYVLSPKLVGNRIGLHPVWIIFALLSGGALFGFLGILLALPVAAVTGVLARFALSRYLASGFYASEESGEGPDS